ncbi:hypothetical protein CLIB1423_03S08350 [[Candida] railenensis]|uniref:VASt domain-containing protein n=1 Tax=[Candida] railenensis TaxID=45579 RepID=A0A9P0VXH4_9ASCO|nr:hypothetical protein CLIB1423_03S08350 [[Candida] railenensis]
MNSSVNDDDDPWSYSFPPSLESLPIKKSDASTDKIDKRGSNNVHESNQAIENAGRKQVGEDDVGDKSDEEDPEVKEEEEGKGNGNGNGNGLLKVDTRMAFSVDDSKDDVNSTVSSDSQFSSAAKSPIPSRLSNQFMNTTIGGNGHASHSSLSLQSPFMMKPFPADPYINKEDANSILSKDSDEQKLKGAASATPKKCYLSGARTSLQQAFDEGTAIHSEGDVVNGGDQPTPLPSQGLSSFGARSSSGGIPDGSPKIITYRKSRVGRPESDGNVQYDNSVFSTPKEKYDTRLYVEEKYKDTNYRYATIKRNTEFHQLFTSLDLTDRLLDDFSCALSREILLQGRLYVSERHVCFNSNLLGWVTNVIIEQSDIVKFEKKLTAGLFPNGMLIETKDAKHNLASLISRDSTFEFMKEVWQGSTGKIMDTSTITVGDNSTIASNGSYSIDANGIIQMEAAASGVSELERKEQQSRFESYILSIDGDDNPDSPSRIDDPDSDSNYSVDDDEDDDKHEDGQSSEYLTSDAPNQIVFKEEEDHKDISENKLSDEVDEKGDVHISENDSTSTSIKVIKFKPDSKYINMGPDSHSPTILPTDFAKENSEVFLCKEQFDVPLGIVFNILYGSENTEFHKEFLEDHDASEITEYDKFHPSKDDPTKLERSYSYRKALGYTIGPKSTKCEVVEFIEHLDFNQYINVLTRTVTPDVPSGNSFSVWTRYCFTWGPNNSTILEMSYFIKWTGRSWIKSVIEKQSLSGQKQATDDLLVKLKAALEKETIEVQAQVSKTKPPKVKKVKTSKTKVSTPLPSSRNESTAPIASSKYSFNEIIRTNIVTVCYFIFSFLVMLLILELRVFKIANENNQLLRHQLLVTSHLVFSSQALTKANGKGGEKAYLEMLNKADGVKDSDFWKFVQDSEQSELNLLDKVEFLTNQLRLLYQKEDESSQHDIFESIEAKFNELKQQANEFKYQDYINVGALRNAIGDLL